MKSYDHGKIEKKWQKEWEKSGIYRSIETEGKPKAYILDMFPYPSGEGLHVGHPKGYIATDIISRQVRMEGKNVLHPMGWDAFGLPAENFAIKNKVHPRTAVEKNVARFKEQLQKIGLDYDWTREINTTDPEYYKWTQWVFLKLFEKGLAYEAFEPINWCPSCQTGLANEDLDNGVCERCGSAVEKKPMRQWTLKITDYAERLLADLDLLPEWQEHIKESQRNWIGKSEGAEIEFEIKGTSEKLKVFTTRADTLFGATYMVIAPEHPLAAKLCASLTCTNATDVLDYVKQAAAKSEIERTAEGKEKTGVRLEGIMAINPANQERIPVYAADYVLAHYGTGAIMAVPAHDERDFAFAKKHNLPVRVVITPLIAGDKGTTQKQVHDIWDGNASYEEEGILTESGEFTGLNSEEAKAKITAKFGVAKVTYKLRDWVFSRQRYWGEPIPIVHCEKCGIVPVPYEQLPVKLPEVEHYEPTGTGESPLAAISEWVNTTCPKCEKEKEEMKYLIFDFDGVLGDTYELNLESRIRMGDAKDRADSIRQMQEYFSAKPHHVRGDHFTSEHKKNHDDWSHRYAVEASKIKYEMFNIFIREIKKIKNAKIAVVSAGFDLYSKGPLEKSGLMYTHFLAGNHDHSKENKIEQVCKDWGVDVKDVYYFTDTQADIYELENLLDRKKIIGCAWGYQGEQKLQEVLPDNQILKSFGDIHELWRPGRARRETNTMPQWAGSSWYWLRFMDPHNDAALVDAAKEKYWAPVDVYVGGAEHATRHLIYARFWHKFLQDIGVVSTPEPFTRLISVGLIMAEDGRKMSKRYGNVINPDDIVDTYGADTLRIYEMFMGPFTDAIAWKTSSLIGARRFLERVWQLSQKEFETRRVLNEDGSLERLLHQTIKKVGEDIVNFKFNTAISQMMIFVNAAEKGITKEQYQSFIPLLAPFAPHVTDEIWHELGNEGSVHIAPWPKYDESKLDADTVTIAVQVNGKTRAEITLPRDVSQEQAEKAAKEAAAKWLEGKEPARVIFVANRLINLVLA